MAKKKIKPTKAPQTRKEKPQSVPLPLPVEMKPLSARVKGKPMLRAVEVTPEILAAVKVYRKAMRISLYQLGKEAITERLTREGYLPTGPIKKVEPES